MIKKGKYKDQDCVIMDNGTLAAVFLPDQGAKLCSLVDLRSGKEYIYQREGETYRMSVYEGDYLEGECSGVDDTFPNIDEYYYDRAPWKGVLLPDHGEVWSQPWEVKEENEALCFTVTGVRMPYILTKRVSFTTYDSLNIEYRLENLSNFSMDYIWAAHMMLRGEEGAQFEFPKGLSKAYTTISSSGTIGTYGDTVFYPFVKDTNGEVYDMSTYRGMKADDYQKFYFAEKLPDKIGWGKIRYTDGTKLGIEFPTNEVPYLGAIQAEGGDFNIRCMFLEPCSGAFDRGDIAKMHGMNSVLEAKEIKKWYLKINIE